MTAISAEAVPGRIASETDKFQVAIEAAERSAAPGARADATLAPVARVVLPATVVLEVVVVLEAVVVAAAVAAGECKCAIRSSGETHDLG